MKIMMAPFNANLWYWFRYSDGSCWSMASNDGHDSSVYINFVMIESKRYNLSITISGIGILCWVSPRPFCFSSKILAFHSRENVGKLIASVMLTLFFVILRTIPLIWDLYEFKVDLEGNRLSLRRKVSKNSTNMASIMDKSAKISSYLSPILCLTNAIKLSSTCFCAFLVFEFTPAFSIFFLEALGSKFVCFILKPHNGNGRVCLFTTKTQPRICFHKKTENSQKFIKTVISQCHLIQNNWKLWFYGDFSKAWI